MRATMVAFLLASGPLYAGDVQSALDKARVAYLAKETKSVPVVTEEVRWNWEPPSMNRPAPMPDDSRCAAAHLAKDQPKPADVERLLWDGKADYARICRGGRGASVGVQVGSFSSPWAFSGAPSWGGYSASPSWGGFQPSWEGNPQFQPSWGGFQQGFSVVPQRSFQVVPFNTWQIANPWGWTYIRPQSFPTFGPQRWGGFQAGAQFSGGLSFGGGRG